MIGENKGKELITLLQKTGLNPNEAQIYFTLLKSGFEGCMVREIARLLPIERTTIYSILRKLIKHGYVKEGGLSKTAKKASIFIAEEPEAYFNSLILKKEKELKKLQEFREKYTNRFQKIYQEGFEYSYDEIDSFMQPYFKPLVEKGWKIKSYHVEKLIVLDYTIYHSILQCPNAKYVNMNGYHVFAFNYNIEEDENALNYFTDKLKKSLLNELLYLSNIKDFLVEDSNIKIFGDLYPSFNIRINIKEIKNLDISYTYFKESKDYKSDDITDIMGISIIFPIKNKLFFLLAESQEILEEMVEPVLNK